MFDYHNSSTTSVLHYNFSIHITDLGIVTCIINKLVWYMKELLKYICIYLFVKHKNEIIEILRLIYVSYVIWSCYVGYLFNENI